MNRNAVGRRRCGCQPSVPVAQLALPKRRAAFFNLADNDAGQIPATCRRASDPVLAGPKLDFQTVVRATHRRRLYRAGRLGQTEGQISSGWSGVGPMVSSRRSTHMTGRRPVRTRCCFSKSDGAAACIGAEWLENWIEADRLLAISCAVPFGQGRLGRAR